MSICNGIAGKRGKNPVGIFIHNDAGGSSMNAGYWADALASGKHNLENGFAHAYAGNDGIQQVEDDANCAWHCGNTDGNVNYLSIEVCQSMGDLKTFKQNEELALQWCAQKCMQYGIIPSENTIRLHQEVYATACPHRSVDIHGGKDAAKQFFISRIKDIIEEIQKPKSAEIVLYNANNYGDNVRWYLEDAGDGYYYFKNKLNGMYISCKNFENGTFITAEAKEKQKFKIVQKNDGNAFYVLFAAPADGDKYWSVEENGTNGSGKTHLKIWEDLHHSKQKFWTKKASDGTYLIIHTYSIMYIGVK